MAIDRGYVTLVEFKAYRDITTTNTTDDGVLETLIEGASRFIDNFCGQFFYSSTSGTVRYYTAEAAHVLFINNISVLETLKTDENEDGTYETTWNTGQTTGDFYLMPFNASEDGKSYSWIEVNPNGDNSFTKARKGVEITGEWGFAAIPDEIRMACYEIVNAADKRRSGQNLTGNAEITAAGVVISPEDITASARAILKSYKRGYG